MLKNFYQTIYSLFFRFPGPVREDISVERNIKLTKSRQGRYIDNHNTFLPSPQGPIKICRAHRPTRNTSFIILSIYRPEWDCGI
jgi:hypothetical protein